jgi:hypothetical protein
VQQIIQHNAEATAAAMLASFPELQGVSTQSLPAVIEAISKTNPQRGAEITNFIQRTRSIMEQAAASRSYQEQQHRAQLEQGARQMQQRFQADANFADSQYDEYVKSQGIPDQQQKAIKAECIQMLRESGMSDQDIYTQYHTNPMFRSFGAQKMMMESALYRMSRRSLGERVARKPVPPVQRPGASGEIASARDYSTRELSARLSYSGSLKDAAALLVARRKG